MEHTTRYAKSGEVHVAYQVFGEGPDLIICAWLRLSFRKLLGRTAFGALVEQARRLLPRRPFSTSVALGLSDRIAPNLPAMDERMDDVPRCDGRGRHQRASLFGLSEGGSLASRFFAASHPERSQSLILYGAFARFFHWHPTDEGFDALIKYIDEGWGTGESLPAFAPSKASDAALRRWWGKFERLGASHPPPYALMRMNREIDISGIVVPPEFRPWLST